MQAKQTANSEQEEMSDLHTIQQEVLAFYEETSSRESVDFRFIHNFVSTQMFASFVD